MSFYDWQDRNRRLREWKIRFTWLVLGSLVGYGFALLTGVKL